MKSCSAEALAALDENLGRLHDGLTKASSYLSWMYHISSGRKRSAKVSWASRGRPQSAGWPKGQRCGGRLVGGGKTQIVCVLYMYIGTWQQKKDYLLSARAKIFMHAHKCFSVSSRIMDFSQMDVHPKYFPLSKSKLKGSALFSLDSYLSADWAICTISKAAAGCVGIF